MIIRVARIDQAITDGTAACYYHDEDHQPNVNRHLFNAIAKAIKGFCIIPIMYCRERLPSQPCIGAAYV